MKRLVAIFVSVALLIIISAMPAAASTYTDLFQEMGNWSYTTTGGTMNPYITPSSGSTTNPVFGYGINLDPAPSGISYRTTEFSTTSTITGDVTFDWEYYFHHAWYHVEADLYIFADSSSGMTTLHLVDFYNAEYTGSRTFSGSCTIHVETGYDFGLIVGGSNYDYSGLFEGTVTLSLLIVDIDIKPCSDPNSINTKSKGVIPVAILGSDELDVEEIDYANLELYFGPELYSDGAEPVHDINSEEVFMNHIVYPWVQSDPDGIPGSGDEVIVTANDDLIPDLVVHFNVQDAGFSEGDVDGYLWGMINGLSFYGVDSVNIVK